MTAPPRLTVTNCESANPQFCWPEAASTAQRILIKPNAGYPLGHPVTVRVTLLAQVIESLKVMNPSAKILILEGSTSQGNQARNFQALGYEALGVKLLDAELQEMKAYPVKSFGPIPNFSEIWAPRLIQEVDFAISVSAYKLFPNNSNSGAGLWNASLTVKNFFGLLPRNRYTSGNPKSRGQLHKLGLQQSIVDVYAALGPYFHYGIVDAEQGFTSAGNSPTKGTSGYLGKVFSGSDLINLDRAALEFFSHGCPQYLNILARHQHS
jgi:uncharacterized protein (DUF362 family)